MPLRSRDEEKTYRRRSKNIFREDHPDYKLVEDDGFQDEGKYSYCTKIFKGTDEKYWAVGATRCGSYFTDYDYMFDTEIQEVEQKEVTVKRWVNVED